MKHLIMRSVKCFAMLMLSVFIMSYSVAVFAAQSGAVRTAPAVMQTPPTINVTAPKVGDAWNIGSSQTITWSYSALTGTVRILLFKGGVPTATTPVLISLTLDGTGNGTFKWTIHPDLVPGDDYTIVVQSNDNPGVKGISKPFSLISKDVKILKPMQDIPLFISITEPTPDTVWIVGTTHTIKWKIPNNAFGDVNINLLQGNNTVQNIVSNVPVKNGSFTPFKIANSITGNPPNDPQFRIDIVGTTNPKLRGTSDFFSILMPPFSLSGSVKKAGNLALSGVTIALGGAKNDTTITDSSGNYSFTNLVNGSYTVTPSKEGCIFTPSNITVFGNSANVTGKNFTGKCGNDISGKVVSYNGIGLPGATMLLILNGQLIATTTTDPGGNYNFSGLMIGFYSVDVSLGGYKFKDAPKKATISGADVNVDFTAYNPASTSFNPGGTSSGAPHSVPAGGTQ